VRKPLALVVAAAFVFALAGCTDLPQTVDSCVPSAPAGHASDAISASGAFGKDPKAKIPTPTLIKTPETSAIHEGTGAVLGKDDLALVQVTIYAGATGEVLGTTGSSGYSKSSESLTVIGEKGGLGTELTCQRVGSRSATVLTAKDYFGSKAAATSANVPADTVLVLVSDIAKGYRGRATGNLQTLKPGFPSVVTAPNGTPGVTLDLQSPPKTAESEVLRKGSGNIVKKSDDVILQVEGIQWTTDPLPTDTFTNTWTKHQPVLTPAVDVSQNTNSVLTKAASKAIIGQPVGSQVLVVVPSKYGYPSGKAPQSYPTSGTLVFVYDILGTR
jgi:peptidylprolyl isomerase